MTDANPDIWAESQVAPLMKNCWNPFLNWIRNVADLRAS